MYKKIEEFPEPETEVATADDEEVIHFDVSDRVILDDNSSDDSEIFSFWDIFKSISSLSIPMALSFTFSIEIFLISLLLNLESTNDDELASTTLIAMMLNTLAVIGMSPLFAMSVIASNKLGELETETAKDSITNEELQEKQEYIAGINRNGLYVAAAVTPIVVSGMVFSQPILTHVFGQSKVVAALTQNFLRIYSPAVPALMSRIAFEQMLFSFKHSKFPMIAGLINLGIGTGIAIILEKGLLGAPRLGATGVAIGMAAEAYLTALAYGGYLARHPDFKEYKFFSIFKKFEGQLQQFKELLKIGGSITTAVATEMAMNLSVGVFSGLVGVKEQSAMSYINQFTSLNFLALAGFGQSCSQEVSRLIGAKQYENASRTGKFGLLSTLIYTTPLPIFFSAAPQFLILSKPKPQDVVAILKYLTPIMAVGVVTDSARYNLLQQLRALGDLKGATVISVSGLSLGVVMSALLGLKTKMNIYGVALGYTSGICIALGGLSWRWYSRIQQDEIRNVQEADKNDEESSILKSSANCFSGFFSKCFKKEEEQRALLSSSETINYTGSINNPV